MIIVNEHDITVNVFFYKRLIGWFVIVITLKSL